MQFRVGQRINKDTNSASITIYTSTSAITATVQMYGGISDKHSRNMY